MVSHHHRRSKKGPLRAALLIQTAEREGTEKGLCDLIKHHATGKLWNYFVLRETGFGSLMHSTAGIIFEAKASNKRDQIIKRYLISFFTPFKYWSIDFSSSFSKSSDSWCLFHFSMLSLRTQNFPFPNMCFYSPLRWVGLAGLWGAFQCKENHCSIALLDHQHLSNLDIAKLSNNDQRAFILWLYLGIESHLNSQYNWIEQKWQI